MRARAISLLAGVALAAPAPARDRLPAPQIPAPCGVNIHFTRGEEGEVERLAAAGFRIVRMDLAWSAVEREAGTYDFSAYDRLVGDMAARGIRILFILDYGHPVHTKGLAPATEAGREAFVAFARAAATRYAGRGILWEIWNEPNLAHFWRPEPSPADYCALAVPTARAIREADPRALILAPATSRIDLAFLEACFRRGLLEAIDVVSVHPYRAGPPETVAAELPALRALIARHAPPSRRIPIVSGEWGYTTVAISPETQADYLVRQQLFDLAQGLKFSIWYDWRDDGTDPKEREHHFGTVLRDFTPKPAYAAMKSLAATLGGFRLVKRLALEPAEVVALLFARDREERLAVWCPEGPREVALPVGRAAVVRRSGERGTLAAGAKLAAGPSPVYVIPEARSESLALERLLVLYARWQQVRAGDTFWIRARLENPLDRPLRVRPRLAAGPGVRIVKGPAPEGTIEVPPGRRPSLRWLCILTSREADTRDVEIRLAVEGREHPVRDRMTLIVRNPVRVEIEPFDEGGIPVTVRVADRTLFSGMLQLAGSRGIETDWTWAPLRLSKGLEALRLRIPCRLTAESYAVRLRVADAGGRPVARFYRGFRRALNFAGEPGGPLAGVHAEGNQVPLEAALTAARGRGDAICARLRYRFGDGWRSISIAPDRPIEIPGRPVRAFVWVLGDGSGDRLGLRFEDAMGMTFQPPGGRVTFEGWRRVAFPMRGPMGDFAGIGPARYPIHWDAVLLVYSASHKAHEGEILFSAPTLVYEEP